MTQPTVAAAPAAGKHYQLPNADFPVLIRVWSKSPWTEESMNIKRGEPLLWQFNATHPFAPGYQVQRMYLLESGAVEVFSSNATDTTPGGTGLRHTIPAGEIFLTEETMDLPTYVEEIEDAEAGGGDDDDDDPEPGDANGLPAEPGGALTPITSSGGQG